MMGFVKSVLPRRVVAAIVAQRCEFRGTVPSPRRSALECGRLPAALGNVQRSRTCHATDSCGKPQHSKALRRGENRHRLDALFFEEDAFFAPAFLAGFRFAAPARDVFPRLRLSTASRSTTSP